MNGPAIQTSPTARATAAARQLDWLLGEALGTVAAPRARRASAPWLAAACVLLGAGVVFGTAHWRHTTDSVTTAPQDAEALAWHECHGPEGLAKVPADVRALRCFAFDDAACAQLARFVALEHLDLGAMPANAWFEPRELLITDVGVRSLAKLPKLRWLALRQCHRVHGYSLQCLEALPQLEHLDLSDSGIVTTAVERLAHLPALRSLVLSHCMGFRGRALAALTTMPGLQRLELANCTTVSAADALALAAMPALRHLDLRDCHGRFRGQIESSPRGSGPDLFVDTDDDGLPDRRLAATDPVPDGAATFVDGDGDGLPDLRVDLTPPSEDGIGITDEVVQALAKLPLQTLRLGGCGWLTDRIGPSLAKMTTLRELDLGELPNAHGDLLQHLPDTLERLAIGSNPHWHAAWSRLPTFAALTALRVERWGEGYADLARAAGTSLRVLEITTPGASKTLGGGEAFAVEVAGAAFAVEATPIAELAQFVAAQTQLKTLILHQGHSGPHGLLPVVAGLERLHTCELHGFQALDLSPLAGSRTLRELRLVHCQGFDGSTLSSLRNVPLSKLDLYGTKCDPTALRALAHAHWPDCDVVLPSGEHFRAR